MLNFHHGFTIGPRLVKFARRQADQHDQPSQRRRRRTTRAALAAASLTLPLLVGPTGTAQALSYPGGRPGYVVSVIGGPVNAVAVRLAMYQFNGNGRVTETYWMWRQNSISGKGNVTWSKPNSGYTTSGCRYNCPIRTPYGFQSGARAATASGSYSVSGSTLTIRWATSTEVWRINTSKPGVAALSLVTNSTSRGWGLGSRQGLGRATTMAGMVNGGYLTGPMAENTYGVATRFTRMGFNPPDYSACSGGTCLQNKQNTSSDKKSWFNAYYATNPARDGRKVFYNMQNGYITQVESPGSTCISNGGGHTIAALQVLDDAGNMAGLVGVEASLNQRSPGQAVVAAFALAAYKYQNSSSPLLR